jgi:hypothetical protein
MAAIAAEVSQRAGGAEAEIVAWYAAGVAHAMRRTARPSLASVLRSLRAERSARLAAVRRNAAAERQARQQAALRDHRRPPIRDDTDSAVPAAYGGRYSNKAAHRPAAARPVPPPRPGRAFRAG